MRIVNHVLFYQEEEIKGKDWNDDKIQKLIPKGKYEVIRKLEDNFYGKNVVTPNGISVTKRFQNDGVSYNRETRRHREKYQGRLKGHKLDYHHKQITKRRRNKKHV